MNTGEEQCIIDSKVVRQSLLDAGFLLNYDKSIFKPVKSMEWLGIIWNSHNFTLSIPERRVNDMLSSLTCFFETFPRITARTLAQITGKIISMSPVIGNVSRLMTRYCYMAIVKRFSWDNLLVFDDVNKIESELCFWQSHINAINCKRLSTYDKSSIIIYYDASNVAAAACTVEIDRKNLHKMWTTDEALKSSTWRELKAIELPLCSFQHVFSGKSLNWYTDNQNCVNIVEAGSMKENLQAIAMTFFSIGLINGISIDIQWIPKEGNTQADYIRKIIDYEDWGVSDLKKKYE
jgi:hypothetical protein